MTINVKEKNDTNWFSRINLKMRPKLIIIFLVENIIPIVLVLIIAWTQMGALGHKLRDIAVTDSSYALNKSATENIERMTTDAARKTADFLYARDDDLRFLAGLGFPAVPSDNAFYERILDNFIETKTGRIIRKGTWEVSADGKSWVETSVPRSASEGGISTNPENNDEDAFNYRQPETFVYDNLPLYDEITYVGIDGQEILKAVAAGSSKKNYPMNTALENVRTQVNGKYINTYIKAENYFDHIETLNEGGIYVSDVIGAYVGSNYIGMYTESIVAAAAEQRGYSIDYKPSEQAYAGGENPNGQRFEGIVRWAMPVYDGGVKAGYLTMALNHDHIMELVDHITPMNERYTELPSAYEGNYAFIWDYKCRSIVHPRHHSIVGFDGETGNAQVPWLETSLYNGWQEAAKTDPSLKWDDYMSLSGQKEFDAQSRTKAPAAALTKAGYVGLDGRYLNNAPQCTGWMDLTEKGGSGSFYILWSGLYKLTTAAAIPYYTGQYAPSEQNNFSRRGFGFVAIGAGLEDFTRPAAETEEKLTAAIDGNLKNTIYTLIGTVAAIVALLVIIAIVVASSITGGITGLIKGISRFRAGERQFRMHSNAKDEFGTLAHSFDDMADSIVDSVSNPLCITDLDRKIIYMNDSALKICRLTLDQAVGTSYRNSSVYPADTQYCPITALQNNREAEVFHLEKEDTYVRGTANYLTDKDGNKTGYIIETTDVTKLHRVQAELEKAVAAANLANEHKGDFLARMSHEIRTPMNAIIGITNIIMKRLNEAEQTPGLTEVKGKLNQIENSSRHLLGLLNDILDISKIEAGKIEITEEPMDLGELAETVSNMIRPRCDEKNIAFTTEFDDFGQSVFMSDPLRLRQVLINLLGNAVKFTPEGGAVRFGIKDKGRTGDGALVRFYVKDNGIGIPEESKESIFKPFEQANRNVTNKYGGTGLGLSICKSIVNMLGGEIKLESKPGEGSLFSFEIVLRDSGAAAAPAVSAAADIKGIFAGKRLLLVDDVDINRMVVSAMLEDTGIAIDEADDGLTALKRFEESAEGFYDVILMDVKMTVLDGYGAAERIRALNRSDARTVPIIALTANAFKDDIKRAIQSGMNAHIAKPVEIDVLLKTLAKYLFKE